jgi:RNA polymerase subunit RPABC4/transcription elongation factor Spt4
MHTLLGKRKKDASTHSIVVVNIISSFIMLPVPAYCQYLTCPRCNSQVPQGSNYCNICGTPLNQPVVLRICPRCKTRITADAHFCPECGQKQ